MFKAGLLTIGSSYFPRLPTYYPMAVAVADFVPEYSGGTVPDSHGIPNYAFRHLVGSFIADEKGLSTIIILKLSKN